MMAAMLPEDYEGWIAFIAAKLGADTGQKPGPDGWLYLTDGDPPLVIVRLTPVSVTVWEYATTAGAAQVRVAAPVRIGSLFYRRIREESSSPIISSLIDAARESRLARFRTCQICDLRTAPELLDDRDVCERCRDGELSAVSPRRT
jgi:hypothetical protein